MRASDIRLIKVALIEYAKGDYITLLGLVDEALYERNISYEDIVKFAVKLTGVPDKFIRQELRMFVLH